MSAFAPPSWTTARLALVLATSIAISPRGVNGQTAHYWGDHFGTESMLLSGAVIGSVTDPGAVFYNPARLLHQEDPAILSSVKTYEWTTTSVKDGLGEGEDLKTSRFRGAPGFVVGTFRIPSLDDHQFAYGILTRHRNRVGFTARDERNSVLPILPGQDRFIGFTEFEISWQDEWFGLSWAYAVSDDVSLGASAFYFDRDLTRRAKIDFRGINEVGDGATFQEERSYTVKDKGLVAKGGLAWRRGRLSAGLTFTLPYWAVSGKGTVRFDDFVLGVPDSEGMSANRLRTLQEGGLPMEWKTPWSIGAGAGWASGDWQLHVAAEYFSPVSSHVLLTAASTAGDASDPITYTVIEERKSVLNGGGGVRWSGAGDVSVFGSIVTNFSSAPDEVVDFTELEDTVNHTTLQTDFILFGGGVSLATRWADLTLGVSWQAGSDDQPRAIDLPTGEPAVGESSVVHLSDWLFLVGFSIPLFDNLLGDAVER
jgi:hypothetical protein